MNRLRLLHIPKTELAPLVFVSTPLDFGPDAPDPDGKLLPVYARELERHLDDAYRVIRALRAWGMERIPADEETQNLLGILREFEAKWPEL